MAAVAKGWMQQVQIYNNDSDYTPVQEENVFFC